MAKYVSRFSLQVGAKVIVTTDFFVGFKGQIGTVVKYNHNTYPQYRTVDVRLDGDAVTTTRFDLTDIAAVEA